MNATNYDQLPINQRADILWDQGKFIEAVELKNFDVSLYELDNNYFEMYYSLDHNRIEKISMINNPERLKIYKRNKIHS